MSPGRALPAAQLKGLPLNRSGNLEFNRISAPLLWLVVGGVGYAFIGGGIAMSFSRAPAWFPIAMAALGAFALGGAHFLQRYFAWITIDFVLREIRVGRRGYLPFALPRQRTPFSALGHIACTPVLHHVGTRHHSALRPSWSFSFFLEGSREPIAHVSIPYELDPAPLLAELRSLIGQPAPTPDEIDRLRHRGEELRSKLPR